MNESSVTITTPLRLVSDIVDFIFAWRNSVKSWMVEVLVKKKSCLSVMVIYDPTSKFVANFDHLTLLIYV